MSSSNYNRFRIDYNSQSAPIIQSYQSPIEFGNDTVPDITLLRVEKGSSILQNYAIQLKKFINEFIDAYFDDTFISTLKLTVNDVKNHFTSDKSIRTFIIAFTDETYSLSNNFENLEYSGDALLRYIVPKVSAKLLPNKSHHFYSQLYMNLTNKQDQAKLGRDLGLHVFARTMTLSSGATNIVGDIFESFIGAIEEVGNSLETLYGMLFVEHLVEKFYKQRILSTDGNLMPNKTQIQQAFGKDNIKSELFETDDGKNIVVVYADINTFNSFKLKPFPYPNFLLNTNIPQYDGNYIYLGYGIDKTKTGAEVSAYDNALNLFKNQGWSWERALMFRANENMANLWKELGIDQKQIDEFYAEKGVKRLKFESNSKTNTSSGSVIQLVKEDNEGKNVILYSIYIHNKLPETTRQGERVLLSLYYNGDILPQ